MNCSTPRFKNSWLKGLGLESSWLKNLGLKIGVEKSGVEMSFNLQKHLIQVFRAQYMN